MSLYKGETALETVSASQRRGPSKAETVLSNTLSMMKTPIRLVRLEVISLAVAFLASFASAQSIWNTPSGNWSSPGSWSPAVVPTAGTNVVFTNNTGAATIPGTVDNTVDGSFSGAIAALQFSQNTNNGGVIFYHAMNIASGQTLTVSNGLTVGTLTDGVGNGAGTNVYVNAQIAGAGGRLNVTGGSLVVNQASAQAGAHLAVLNMTNLDTFTANIGRLQVGVANGVNRAEGNLFLAKTNTITLFGTAPQLFLGFNNGNNNGNNGFPILQLGESNAFFVDSITISADKQGNPASRVLFNPVFTNSNPYAYFRGTNGGTSRVSSWVLGNNGGQTTTGSTSDATNDFSFGILDAMVDTMTIGISEKGAGATVGSGTGTFTFTAGTNNVNSLILGQRICTAGNSVGSGTMNVNGTATLIVNNAICLSQWAAGNNVFGAGNLNVNGGTVLANTITNGVPGGGNLANVTINGGTLGITSLLGSVGTTASPINNLSLSDSILQMPVSGLQTNAVAAGVTAGGTTNIINITSVPASVITYPTQFPLIAYGGSGLSGFNFGVSNLPGTYQGFISNNTANSTIDLVLTGGPNSISTLEWKGSAGANWNTITLNWLNGASPVAYFDGASVLFDDNATGPTAVNISSTVSPASVTVSNSALNYSLSGSGIGGSGGITKYGSGTLLFTNSGNAFLGNVTINAGTVQFGAGGTSGTLPATGSVTDNGNLVINHSNNHALANTISGSGTLTQSGSNVLTVSAANGFNGTAVVNSGTLVLSGVLSGGMTNAPGSTVGGSGTNVGVVNVSGVIQPSAGTATPATFTAGGLNLLSGATLKFNLTGADATVGSGINDLLELTGNLNANNNVISVIFAGVPQTGVPYTLIDFPSGTQSGTLSLVTGTHFSAAINQGTSPVTLTLSGSGANLKWAPGVTNLWDVGVTSNWLNGASSDVFYSGDHVLFDDSVGVATNVIVGAGAVYPNVVTVNSSANNFVISGPGRISGQASIQKSGSSILTLASGNNDFSNAVQVTAGTLRLGANGAAGHGTVFITNGAVLDLNASTMAGSAVVSGTGIAGNGAVVNNGFILNGDQHAFDAGTTLFLAGDTSISSTNRWDIRNGSLTSFDGNPWNLTLVGSNDFHLVNATVDPALGNVDVQSGRLVIETTTLQVSSTWANDQAHAISVESGAQLSLSPSTAVTLGRTINLNSGSLQNSGGNSVVNGPFNLQGSANIDVSAGTLEIDSAITGSGSLTKTSGQALKLTGVNTYTNSTLVSGGSLSLNDSAAISNSVYVNVAAGATIDVSTRSDTTFALGVGQTLQGNGSVFGSLLVSPGSTVSPGASLTSIGALTVTNTSALSGTAVMKLNAGSDTSDVLLSTNGLTCGGTIVVTNLSGTFTNGEKFQLFVSTNFSGTFASVILPNAPGLTWTNNLAVDGTLTAGVASGPAPQPYITSVRLSGTNLVLNGTNGLAGEQYDLMTSTNLAVALSNWTSVTSGTFSSGNFSITNPLTSGSARQFYIIRIP